MATNDVPDIVIGRLPIYLRALTLLQEAGQEITSSHELGDRLGIGSAQIRKDLSHFGEFGKQGTGYEISYLREQIAKILHVDRDWTVALVGFGDLGQAILHYGGFHRQGFHIEAIFDNDPEKIGQQIEGKTVRSLDNLAKVISAQNIRIAILAVPAGAAQEVANTLIEMGIKAILNYAPITLSVPGNIQVQYVDPVMHLQRMAYYLE
ncbi:MAG: redox-sensing transcriptional repressor Rex [Anaerolineae bacterium]|nr:redox-sensing transcriptional repressor Rex [Anaerolineae bacterium]